MNDPVTADRLQRAWAVLTPPRSSPLSSYPLEVTADGVPCRVAVDRGGLRHLLIPAGEERPAPDPRPSVLSNAVTPLRFDGATSTYVDVSCLDPELNLEFDEVVDDVLDAVDGSAHPASAALECLARWRRLFRARLLRGMGAQARVGLFAELIVLQALLQVAPDLRVDVWTGPLGEPHDFEAPNGCLEIKAIGSRPEPIAINGIRQLDTHDGRPLELVVINVVPDPDGTALGELVAAVEAKIGDPAAFRGRLSGLGWQPDAAASGDDCFVVGEIFRIPVTPSVPQLVESSLVSGTLSTAVLDVTYRLDQDSVLAHAAGGGLGDIVMDAL